MEYWNEFYKLRDAWLKSLGKAPTIDRSNLSRQVPLAVDDQDGYVMWIVYGVDDTFGVGNQGTKFIKDITGTIVQTGYWTDWPEDGTAEGFEAYIKLTRNQRAAMELIEQKKYGYAQTFAFHRGE